MYTYTDGLYEIEYRRLCDQQRYIMKKARSLDKQIKYYEPSQTNFMGSEFCKDFFEKIKTKLNELSKQYDIVELDQKEISIKNIFRDDHDNRVSAYITINQAYEQAYAAQAPETNAAAADTAKKTSGIQKKMRNNFAKICKCLMIISR